MNGYIRSCNKLKVVASLTCCAACIGLGVSYFCVLCDDDAVMNAAHEYVRAISNKETSPCGMVEIDKCPTDLSVIVDRELFKTTGSSYFVVLHASVSPAKRFFVCMCV